LGKLCTLLKEFHRIVCSQKSSELDSWIEVASTLQVDELDNYISGLKRFTCHKNGIYYKCNNRLAEGIVNKIKLELKGYYMEGIVFYCSKQYFLLNEHFYQIN
jgi:hypothetical protein